MAYGRQSPSTYQMPLGWTQKWSHPQRALEYSLFSSLSLPEPSSVEEWGQLSNSSSVSPLPSAETSADSSRHRDSSVGSFRTSSAVARRQDGGETEPEPQPAEPMPWPQWAPFRKLAGKLCSFLEEELLHVGAGILRLLM